MATAGIDWRSADREKRLLLDVARRALTAMVVHGASLNDLPTDEAVSRPGGAFVTLRHHRQLRGCVGEFPAETPLVEVVASCAGSVARDDARFSGVRPDELAEIDIELSIVSLEEDIDPNRIEIGKHGLSVSCGRRRGALLPQVAAQHSWTSERFLGEACLTGDSIRMPGK